MLEEKIWYENCFKTHHLAICEEAKWRRETYCEGQVQFAMMIAAERDSAGKYLFDYKIG